MALIQVAKDWQQIICDYSHDNLDASPGGRRFLSATCIDRFPSSDNWKILILFCQIIYSQFNCLLSLQTHNIHYITHQTSFKHENSN